MLTIELETITDKVTCIRFHLILDKLMIFLVRANKLSTSGRMSTPTI